MSGHTSQVKCSSHSHWSPEDLEPPYPDYQVAEDLQLEMGRHFWRERYDSNLGVWRHYRLGEPDSRKHAPEANDHDIPKEQVVIENFISRDKEGRRILGLVKKRWLDGLATETGRDVIVYFSGWQSRQEGGANLHIDDNDIMDLARQLRAKDKKEVDLIFHSPGGDVEAAAAFVRLLRDHYRDVRVIVPHLAASADTMVACSGNRLMMGKQARLGPVDPQLTFVENGIPYKVSARSVMAELERINSRLEHGIVDEADMVTLGKYRPGQIQRCRQAMASALSYAEDWLREYMFGDVQQGRIPAQVSRWLATHHDSDCKHIDREALMERGLLIDKLEDFNNIENHVMAICHTFELYMEMESGVAKVIGSNLASPALRFV